MDDVLNQTLPVQQGPAAGRTGSLALLHRRLNEAQAFGPAYDGAMSNHLPMALHAAWEMGAEAERLQRLVDGDRLKLEAATPASAAVEADARRAAEPLQTGIGAADEWLIHRGQPADYPWLQAYFSALLAGLTPRAVLAAHLPVLLGAPHAFAFHGLIRVAHAVESAHTAELAEIGRAHV